MASITETSKSTCLEVCSSIFRPLPWWCILCKKSQTTVRITYKRGTWGTANHKVIWKFMNIAQHLSYMQINCIPVRLWRKGWIKTILVHTSIIQIFSIWFYLKLAVLQKLFSFIVTYTDTKGNQMIAVPSTDSYFLHWLTSVSWDLDV